MAGNYNAGVRLIALLGIVAVSALAAPVSAEGLYWSGIALFQQEKRPVDWLRDYWSELGERFPESRWWTHADVWGIGGDA